MTTDDTSTRAAYAAAAAQFDALLRVEYKDSRGPREMPPERQNMREWPRIIIADGVEHVWHEPVHDVDGCLSHFEERRVSLRPDESTD